MITQEDKEIRKQIRDRLEAQKAVLQQQRDEAYKSYLKDQQEIRERTAKLRLEKN
jgi:hypothetical protein